MPVFVNLPINTGASARVLTALFAVNLGCCCVGQTVAVWTEAQVTKTDLLAGDTNYGKFAYSFASVTTRAGCHVAKVEGERGKQVFVRRDGRRGKPYKDIAHPLFSPDGSTLGYAVRDADGSRFVINDREDLLFQAVYPDTFVLSNDGKRHAYIASRGERLVAVVDGVPQLEGEGDLIPRLQPPVFSADGSSVGYLEGSESRKKIRAVVNGKPGKLFDWVALDSLMFSADGSRYLYSANDRSAGNKWFCVIDGQQRSLFDGTGVSFAISRDAKRVAYTGRRGANWFLVVDGDPEIPIEGIVDHCVAFSPDSRRLAYAVARPDRRAYLVLDGKAGPPQDGIGGSWPRGLDQGQASMQTGYALARTDSLLFSPDSRHLAYLVRTGQTRKVVLDGKADEVEMDYLEGGMVFSDDSRRLAYGGRALDDLFRDKCFLVVDGKRGVGYDALGYFGFSHDGKHVAYVARKGAKFVIVVDGVEHGEYGAIPAGPVFRVDEVLEFLAAERSSLYRIEVRNP